VSAPIRRAWLLVLALAPLLLPAVPRPAIGHGRSISYSNWDLDAHGARVRVRISLLELTRLPFGAAGTARQDEIGDYLAEHLRMRTDQGPCPVSRRPVALVAGEGWSVHEWRVACPAGAGRTLESELLLAVAPSHLHFARLHGSDGSIQERVLSWREPRWILPRPEDASQPRVVNVLGYVRLGVEHIASGVDHLAFLLALILLAASVGEVATLVTGFTVAHSVTLGLAALGLVRPDPDSVEALIGFSVALVAAENAWLLAGRRQPVGSVLTALLLGLGLLAGFGLGGLSPLTLGGLALFCACHFGLLARVDRAARLRVAVAFAFGLVHGFGFAGVLGELELPRNRLVPALFGFNLGVEAGQLAIVAVSWPLLRLLAGAGSGRGARAIAELGSAAVCGLGVFWFLSRNYS
jgi:hypothetical protein